MKLTGGLCRREVAGESSYRSSDAKALVWPAAYLYGVRLLVHHGLDLSLFMNVLDVEDFATADELLKALWRQDVRWQPFPRHWVFRGQGSASWDLTPTAFRAGVEVYFGSSAPFRLETQNGKQVLSEARIVQAFLTELDRQGIAPPTESAERWRDIFAMFGDLMADPRADNWPPRELAPLFGLAQHHGIPTRLLDWSERPLVGAYFAALDACRLLEAGLLKDEDRLAVWALNYEDADLLFTLLEEDTVYPHFEMIRPPRGSNRNLLAQSGVFSLVVTSGVDYKDPPTLDPLDRLIERRATDREGVMDDRIVLRKLTLPVYQAGRLLRLLDDDHVSGTFLFPGIDGVARGLFERKYWDIMKITDPTMSF